MKKNGSHLLAFCGPEFCTFSETMGNIKYQALNFKIKVGNIVTPVKKQTKRTKKQKRMGSKPAKADHRLMWWETLHGDGRGCSSRGEVAAQVCLTPTFTPLVDSPWCLTPVWKEPFCRPPVSLCHPPFCTRGVRGSYSTQ